MKKFIVFLLLTALAGGGYWYYQTKQKQTAEVEEAQKFTPAKVELKTMRRTVESTGEVRPENRLEVKSPIAGRLEELLVKEGEHVEKGQIVAWVSSTERATLLDTARAKGADEVAYWEGIYKAAPLVAPLSGTVIVRSLEPGQTITASSAVIVIADRLIIVGQVDETDIGSIFTGQPVNIQLDAYPDAAFDGSVKSIAYDSKIVSNVTTYEVNVTPENLPAFARSGMTATLTYLVEEHRNVPAVPTAALEYRDGKPVVRLPAAEGTEPVIRPVRIGLSQNSFTEILKGLQAGDDVLIPQIARKKANAKNPFLPSRPSAGTRTNNAASSRPQGSGTGRPPAR